VFSDIEGSTLRWDRDRAAMQDAVRRHDAIVRAAVAAHGGHVFKTVGDAFCAVFPVAAGAVAAALDAQRALGAEDFSAVDGLPVRMAIHTGNADERDGDYFGPALNRVSRLLAVGHGGQVLVSGVSTDLVQGQMPPTATLHDLGAHRLKDLARPEQVYQLLAPDLRAEFPTLRSLDALPNNLPQQLTSFVGRDAEVADVAALLRKHRVVTLIGAGGVGKTRVSLQVGANLLDAYPDGVWFVELAPLRDEALVPETIAKAVDATLRPNVEPLEALVAALKQKRLLLILDNCEHLVAAVASAAAAIVRGCPNVTILASSRQGLGVTGEGTYRMPSLAIPALNEPAADRATDALAFGAIRLFVTRAEAADARFAFADDIAPIVADICRRLDGIPLAIELAAARVNVLKPHELRSRLDQRFRVLTSGSRDVLPRQQTLRALIDWSHDLLTEPERRLFRRVGIFVDGFTLAGAAAVAGDAAHDEFETFDVLASLVDKSLVVAELDGDATRYRLLESTRAYALEMLGAAGERATAAEERFTYVHDLFVRAGTSYEQSPREATVLALVHEVEEMRACLEWALEHDVVRGAELLVATPLFLELGLYREGAERAERFSAALALRHTASEIYPRTLIYEVQMARARGDTVKAMRLAEDAVAIARSRGDASLLTEGLLALARMRAQRRNFEEAREAATEATRTVDAFTPRQEIEYLFAIGTILFQSGERVAAGAIMDDAIARFKVLGNERSIVWMMQNVAENAHAMGDTSHALAIIRELLGRSLVNRTTFAHAKMNYAGYLLATDDVDEALRVAREALGYYRVADGASVSVGIGIEHIALGCALQGEFERAARLEGFANRFMVAVGFEREYTEATTRERLMSLLRERFSAAELENLLAEGAALGEDAAFEEAMSGTW
jgi:predicted ATPase/class 3 adenylate cyclase